MKFTQFKKECKQAFDEVGREQFGQGTNRWKYRDDFEDWFETCVIDPLYQWFKAPYENAFNPESYSRFDKEERKKLSQKFVLWFNKWQLTNGNWFYDWNGGSYYEEFHETETFIFVRFDKKIFDMDVATGKFRYPTFKPEYLLFFPNDEIKLQPSLPTLMKMGCFSPAVAAHRNTPIL